MRLRKLHEWDVTMPAAKEIQLRLRGEITYVWKGGRVKTVAGADVSFPDKKTVRAAVVYLAFPSLRLLHYACREAVCRFPYVPGYLAFREAPVLLDLFSSGRIHPDLVVCDGQGIAHPRGMGLASHLGLFLNIPTVGVAKSLLWGTYREPARKKGSTSLIRSPDGQVIGAALRTRDNVRPVFVSVGHKINLDRAIDYVLRCSPKYRISEPIRLAHRAAAGVRL